METRFVAQPASYSVGTMGSSPRVKRPGRKTEHLSPPKAHVKNEWSFSSTSPTWRAQKQLNFYILWQKNLAWESFHEYAQHHKAESFKIL